MELKEKGLHREGSLCNPDPHQQLLRAFQDRDLVTFQNILNQGTRDSYINPDNWFEDPHYGTLLDLACRTPNNSQYVRALLQAGADPNKINPVRKKSPLHFTIEAKDLQSFELILNDSRTNPNILDNKGNPPIHSAAELQNSEFLVKLLNHPSINVSLSNKKGQTALHVAAQQENEENALLLIMAGIDLDNTKNAAGKTGRDMVLANLPELEKKLPSGKISKEQNGSPNDLFSMLHRRDTETFLTAVRVQDKSNLDHHDGSHTYLQYACDVGLNKVVDSLLREGANPNATSPNNVRPPLMLAGYRGYVHIIRLFINNDATQYTAVDGENVLHSVIKGITDDQLPLGASKENRDHYKCLELLLQEVPRSKLDLNCGDVKGNTPLHYAAKHGDAKVILLLLRNGAYVGQRNLLGQPAFADINPKILENYLDECLMTNDKLPREDNYKIIFKYNFLAPPKLSMKSLTSSQVTLQLEANNTDVNNFNESIPETDPLMYMTRSTDFRPLLKHPILTSFIYLKWHRIQRFFFFNLTFYCIFWALLTGYVLGIYGAQKTQPDSNNQGNDSRENIGIFKEEPNQSNISELFRVLVAIFLIIFILRELFQLAISPVKYICNPENWLEIALIGVTVSILFGNTAARQQMSAIAILLSWAELVLLIGRHPANSTNIEMLKTVSWNFLTFLAWYSILIIAFALSFYSLFHDSESEDNFFSEPGISIFKTVVMLTGEFDAGSIPFVAHPGVSHVLFVTFVFLIAIVLFNLLNGLAVSDTQAIRADAELVGYVSQIKLVSYIETMALGDPTPFKDLMAKLKTLCCYIPDIGCCSTQFGCLKVFSKKINLFTDLYPDYDIHVLPNQENKVETFGSGHRRKRQELTEDDSTCIERCSNIYMDPTVMKAAREILSRRAEEEINRQHNKSDDERDKLLVEYGKRLDRYRDQLEAMRKSSDKTQMMLQELLDLAKREKI